MIHCNPWLSMEANMDVLMKKKNAMDVSSFLLFEATGDSEADINNYSDNLISGVSSGNVAAVAMGEDDAQSCSYDSTDIRSADDELNDVDDHGDGDVDQAYSYHRGDGDVQHAYSHGDDDHEEDEEECSSVYHRRWGGEHDNTGMPLVGHQLKSTVSIDSTKEFELLNEVEKSRLFWETCLAS